MTDIIIKKVNEVYLKLECERHLQKELSEYFTFFAPNFKFAPAFKNKIWDGKIRLFNLTTRQIYFGLFKYIEEFCKDREYSFSYEGFDADVEDEFSMYHAKKFITDLNIHSNNKAITVNEHQIDAFVTTMQSRRKLFLSPTSSGKSLIAYIIFRQLLDYQKLKGLMIVPTTALVEQMYSDFEDYSSHNGFDVESNVHRIYDYKGKVNQTNKGFTISTWQSLQKLPEEFFEQFDYIIGDECHLFKANSLQYIMTKLVNTKYRVGMTGTLDGTQTHKLVLEGLFGNVKKVISTNELMQQGKVSQLEIKCLVLNYPEEERKFLHKKPYQEEIDYIISHPKRNKFIRNLALSLDKNTLILFQKVDKHGRVLYDLIRTAEKLGDRKVFFIHGKVETEEREIIRKILETEKNAILIASYGTFSTGSNVRNLHNLITASPSKGQIRVLQSIGRMLRLSENKELATFYDISDDFRFKGYKNHGINSLLARIEIYKSEKFKLKNYKIGIK